MGKKSRARVAAAGTRKDPERRVVEGDKAERADRGKKVGAHAHPEWAPHLNTASEDLTAKLFTMVEVILGVVPVVVIGLFLASKDATSVDKLTDVFSQDPSMVVTFISACLQPFVAYMLYMIYRKYCEGDAGFAAGNLIGLLCSEIFAAQYSRRHRHRHLVVARCGAMLLRISRAGCLSAAQWACWSISRARS